MSLKSFFEIVYDKLNLTENVAFSWQSSMINSLD